jgi:uncharacterized protein (DUF433 family)
MAEAAALVRVPLSTLKRWVGGDRASGPGFLCLPRGRPRLLAFSHLVEVFTLATIRREHGVALERVRAAIEYVERRLSVTRPLLRARFMTDGVHLFVEQRGRLVSASEDGQVTMHDTITAHVARIEWDEAGVPVRLFPLVRAGGPEQPRSVVIDPERGFGRPTLAGTGVRVDVVVGRYRAGENTAGLARDYGVTEEAIEDAIRCELHATN